MATFPDSLPSLESVDILLDIWTEPNVILDISTEPNPEFDFGINDLKLTIARLAIIWKR